MKLSDFETDEQLANAVSELVKSAVDTEVKGLKDKNSELLGKMKAADEKRQQAEDERKQKELDALKSAGEVEKLEEKLRDEYAGQIKDLQDTVAARDESLSSLDGEILGGKRETALTGLASKFINPKVGQRMLDSMVETVRTENGIVTNFKDENGEILTNDPEKFYEHLAENEDFQPLLKGVQSSGGNALGGNNANGEASGNKSQTQVNLEKRLAAQGIR